MKVWGDFLGLPRSTDKTTLIIKVSNGAKIRNRYNQGPHLSQSELETHCKGDDHKKNITSDEGHNWKYRPPPRGLV